MHFVCTATVVLLGSEIRTGSRLYDVCEAYTCSLKLIMEVGSRCDYDILTAMDEKLEYNKTRADHKRENRALTNGKKF